MTTLRVGTWNVEYALGVERNARRAAILRDADADIWALTETHDELDLSSTHAAVSTLQRPSGRVGGRWTTIWTRCPVLAAPAVADPIRTVAALLDTPFGPVLVYGTVMPWGNDAGPDPKSPSTRWTEQGRVLPEQVAEWARLRGQHPGAALVVAGDFNMNLGGKHHYGTLRGRVTLREGSSKNGLFCATETERVPSGALRDPPIDHVAVPACWEGRTTVAAAWEGRAPDGVKLSDHSGLVVEVR